MLSLCGESSGEPSNIGGPVCDLLSADGIDIIIRCLIFPHPRSLIRFQGVKTNMPFCHRKSLVLNYMGQN